jgi:hypothetical protein
LVETIDTFAIPKKKYPEQQDWLVDALAIQLSNCPIML